MESDAGLSEGVEMARDKDGVDFSGAGVDTLGGV